jgi:O-antigen/teichoic acid export membrane protein
VTERTGQPARSLSADAGALMLGLVVSQGAVLLTLSVAARLVTKDEVGTYQQLSLVYSITAPLFLGGIPAALLYFLPRAGDRQEMHEWVVRSYLLLGLFGVGAAALTVALRHPLADLMDNPELAPALVLYAPYVAFAFLIAVAPSVLIATGRARAAGVVNAMIGMTTLVGVTAAALIEPDARAIALGLSIAGGLTALGTIAIVARSLRLPPRVRLSRTTAWLPILGFGLPIAFGGLMARVGYQFDRVVVGANFPPEQFAIYALGAVELPLSLLLQQAVSNVLAPALTTRYREGDLKGMVALWREALRKTTLIVAPMFAYLMVEAGDVIRVLYGRGYAESSSIFRIYLLFLPLRIATWGLIPQAAGRTRINLIAGSIILPVNVIVAVALVDPLGLEGPAYAAPAAAFAATVYYLVMIRGLLSTPIRELLPLRHGALCFAVSGLAAAAIAPLLLLDMPAAVRLGISLCLFAPGVVFALRRLGLLTTDDWARLRGLVDAVWPRWSG